MSIKKLIRFLFFLHFITVPRQAIAFDQGFSSTTTFSISSVGGEGITYDYRDLEGEFTYDFLDYINLDYLTDHQYRSRVYDRNTRVSVPPYSEIDVGYYWYNNTEDIVDVESIRIPLSRQIQSNGDSTEILYDTNFIEEVTCSSDICRGGKYMEVEGIGIVFPEINEIAQGRVVVATLKVKPPVEITHYEIEYWNEYLSSVVIYVRNNTSEYLRDIDINYKGTVSKRFDLEPYQERIVEVFKKCVLAEESVNCGSMNIYQNNIKTHCIVYGSRFNRYDNPEAISVFSEVDGQWIAGAHVQPDRESFCIERIPYVYTTPDMIAYIEPEEPEITTEQYWQELLDIDMLPVTSYQLSGLERYLILLKPFGIDNL